MFFGFQTASDGFVTPILIDTDGGYYDAWGLALALKSASNSSNGQRFKVVGITTVHGGTTVDQAIRNVGAVMQSLGGGTATNNPMFKGMDSPCLSTRQDTQMSDGFVDVLNPMKMQEPKIGADHAVNAIIKFAEMYQGKLTILALGPLTNLAMAVKLQPRIKHYIKEIFISGGNSEGTVPNAGSSEYNFYVDPEAAHIVFEQFNPAMMYLLPWETCRSAASTLVCI